MKKTVFIGLFLVCMIMTFPEDSEINKVTLTLKVLNIKNDKGTIRAALFDSKDSYDSSSLFMGIAETIKDHQSVLIFENVPVGEYAIQLFHDKNGNDELDTGLFGIPKEDYAFSNNIPGPFGPPDYDKVKFIVTEDTTIIIRIE